MTRHDILPGLRVIFESDTYKVHPEYRAGFVLTKQGKQVPFVIMNSLCTVEEMGIFNHTVLKDRVRRAFGEDVHNVVFDTKRCGISNFS